MKTISIFIILSFVFFIANSQTVYYKGEWTKVNSQSNFSCILKLAIQDTIVNADILWMYIAIDSSDILAVDYYKNKKGSMGIEYATGHYTSKTRDIIIQGQSKTDPDLLISLDKYILKLSLNKQVIYGETYSNGDRDGLVYFIKTEDPLIGKEFDRIKARLLSISQGKAFTND